MPDNYSTAFANAIYIALMNIQMYCPELIQTVTAQTSTQTLPQNAFKHLFFFLKKKKQSKETQE